MKRALNSMGLSHDDFARSPVRPCPCSAFTISISLRASGSILPFLRVWLALASGSGATSTAITSS